MSEHLSSPSATTRPDEKEAVEDALAAKIQELERAKASLDVFVTAASHDLISPLQTILGFSRLLEREIGDGSPTCSEFLGHIDRSVTRMHMTIQRLTEHARITSRELVRERVMLGEIVEQARMQLCSEIDASGAEIRLERDITLDGDRHLLTVLIEELLANAIRYAADTPPQIRIESRLDPDRNGGMASISVRDDGIGFEPEFAEAIFEPLRRLHGPADRPGAGLGLAICRSIVRAHGGTIHAEGEPRVGSIFRIQLPSEWEEAPSPAT